MMSGRIAYQVHIINGRGQESFDLFRTEEAAQAFIAEYVAKVEAVTPTLKDAVVVTLTGPFTV